MRAGELRHRVAILRKNIARDMYGAAMETWDTLATVWGSIEALSGKEYFNAAQVRAEATYRIRIRYFPNITPAMRVMAGDRIFDIQAVLDPDGRRQELILIAKEVV